MTGAIGRAGSRPVPGRFGLAGRRGALASLAPAVLVAARWWPRPAVALALGAATVVLGALVEIDLAQRRLPNPLVGLLAAGSLAGLAADAMVRSDGGDLVRGVVVGSAFSAAFLVLSVAGSVGPGDVKLAWPVGAIAGWIGGAAVPVTVLAMTVSGALVAVAVLVAGRGRHRTLPYGPFLALGAVAGMVAGAP